MSQSADSGELTLNCLLCSNYARLYIQYGTEFRIKLQVQQSFQAPRCYLMPSREDRTAYTEAELGMKIACGFEMLYQERLRAGEEGKGATWEAFKKSLEESGCFDGLLPGSKEYKRVLEESLAYYKSTSLFARTRY